MSIASQRRMRYLIMDELADKSRKSIGELRFNAEVSQEEFDEITALRKQIEENKANGLPYDYNISRLQLETVAKFTTSFRKIAEVFINTQKGRGNSEATIKHYQQSIRKLAKFFCWLSADNIDYEDLSDDERREHGLTQPYAVFETDNFEAHFRDFLIEEEGVSEITVATYFRDYKAIAYWMMDEGLIKKHTITIRSVEADIKDCYTEEEVSKLLKAPKEDASFTEVRNWVIVNWVLATGNRISTIANIKITDVDFEDEMININIQKNKRKVRIPLQSTLKKVLKNYIADWLIDEDGKHYTTEYLFPSAYETYGSFPMSRNNIYKTIAQYNRDRGVYKTSFHLFRHTFAKNWIINGGDLHSLQRVLGHSTLAMVVKYANLYGEDLKPKVEDFSVLATRTDKSRVKRRTRTKRER